MGTIILDVETMLLLVTWAIQLIGIISLFLVIWTFALSEVLRTHPGSLIMMYCIFEFSFYYLGFIQYSYDLYNKSFTYFNTMEFISNMIFILTFKLLHFSENELYGIIGASCFTLMAIVASYYICLSLDIIFIIRNPLYSPSRRLKLYHFYSIIFPFFTLFPLSIIRNCNYMHIYIYIYYIYIIYRQSIG